MNLKTFFLSEDIDLILNGNSILGDFYRERGIAIPTTETINEVRLRMLSNLKNTYGSVEVIPEKDLLSAMKGLAEKSSYPLVSLDEIYLKGNPNVQQFLNLSRIKIGGKTFMSTRNSEGIYLPFEKEISRVTDSLKETFGGGCPHRNFAYRWCCF